MMGLDFVRWVAEQHCLMKSEQLKDKFEVSQPTTDDSSIRLMKLGKLQNEMNCDSAKLYDYWDRGFHWTCCGLPIGV
jgi:hypothetical protein